MGYAPDPDDDGPHQYVTPYGVPFYVSASVSRWIPETALLIDTGAVISLLPLAIYKQVSEVEKGKLVPTQRIVCCGNQTSVNVGGIAYMNIRIENIEYQATFHITPDIPKGILGQDFLDRYDATIESQRRRLSIQGRSVQLYDENGLPLQHRVTAMRTVRVPPGSRYVVPGRILGKGDLDSAPFLIEGDRKLYDRTGILVAKMFTVHNNYQLGVEVHNTTDEEQKINRNTTLGSIEQVKRVCPWSTATVDEFQLSPEQLKPLYDAQLDHDSDISYDDMPELLDVDRSESESDSRTESDSDRGEELSEEGSRHSSTYTRTYWDACDPANERYNDDPQAYFDDWVESYSSEEGDSDTTARQGEEPLSRCNMVSYCYRSDDDLSVPEVFGYDSEWEEDETTDSEVSKDYCDCDHCTDESAADAGHRREAPEYARKDTARREGNDATRSSEENEPVNIYMLFTKRPEYEEPENEVWTCSSACYPYGDIPEYHVEGLHPHMREVYSKYAASLELPWDKFAFYLLLQTYSEIFAKDRYDLGKTNLAYHHIDTGDARPFKQKPRRLPQAQYKEMETQVQKLADIGIIRPSNSNYASNVLLVQKKDNTWRLCIDYRRLNAQTVNKDPYLIPRIDDTLEHLQGAKYFCTLDLAQGYHQVEMDEESKAKTAFTTPHMTPSLWEFNCMPFGITGGPGTFQRVMDRLLVGMQYKIALAYLDDIIVYGMNPQQVIDRLARVFDRIKGAGLKLKPSKCTFFERETLYLGHIVSREGIKCDPAKIEKVKEWPRPKSGKECLQFVGFCNYYNRFLKDFSAVAKPLYALGPKKVPFKWDEEEENSYQQLKAMLTSPPVMAYPREVGPWILDTDASGFAMGAVLAQMQPNEEGVQEERVIAYGSKVFQGRQQRYCTRRRELLSVVHFVNMFRPYLYGRFVTIRTDHASLRYLKTLNNPDDQFARWIQILEETYYTIEVRKGSLHGNADAMSRIPGTECEGKRCICLPVARFEEAHGLEDDYRIQSAAFDDDTGGDPQVGDGSDTEDEIHGQPQPPAQVKAQNKRKREGEDQDGPSITINAFAFTRQWKSEEMASAQASDPDIELLYMAKKLGADKPSKAEIGKQSSAARTYFHDWKRIKFENNRVLYRQWESSDGTEIRYQIILPEVFQQALFKNLHDAIHAAHMGRRRTMSKLQKKFYWHRMGEDIQTWIRACPTCQRRKALYKNPKAPMQSHHVGMPNERVAIDIIDHLPKTLFGNICVLTIVDHFTKYAKAVALPDQKAKTVADAFMKWWVCVFGTPYQVHSDQGRNFESGLMQELCQLLRINKTRTTPYNPSGNGQCERQNQTIMNLIHTYARETPVEWDKHLHTVLMGYNATKQESTNLEPNRLMLGRNLDMPADLMMEHDPTVMPKTVNEYVADMEKQLRLAYQLARKNLTKSATAVKRHFDKNAHMYSYETGQMVKVRVSRKLKGQKFVDKYEGPYYVIDNPGSETTFRVVKTRHSKIRTLHHNKLLPYNPTPEEKAEDNTWVFELARRFWNLRASNQECQTELTIGVDENQEGAVKKLTELVRNSTRTGEGDGRQRGGPLARRRPGWWRKHQEKKTARMQRETRRALGDYDGELMIVDPHPRFVSDNLHVKTYISTDLSDEQCDEFWRYMALSRHWNKDTGIRGLFCRLKEWGTHSNDPQPLRALAKEMEWYGIKRLNVGHQTFLLTPALDMPPTGSVTQHRPEPLGKPKPGAGMVHSLRAREMGTHHTQRMFVSTASQTHVYISPELDVHRYNEIWYRLLRPMLDFDMWTKSLDQIKREGCYACRGICQRFEEGDDPEIPCRPYDRMYIDWTPGIHEPSLANNIAMPEMAGWRSKQTKPMTNQWVQTDCSIYPNQGTSELWENSNETDCTKDQYPPEFKIEWQKWKWHLITDQLVPLKKQRKRWQQVSRQPPLMRRSRFTGRNYEKSFLDDIQLCSKEAVVAEGLPLKASVRDYEAPDVKYSLRSRDVVTRDKIMMPRSQEELMKEPIRRRKLGKKRELIVADIAIQTVLSIDKKPAKYRPVKGSMATIQEESM